MRYIICIVTGFLLLYWPNYEYPPREHLWLIVPGTLGTILILIGIIGGLLRLTHSKGTP